MRIRIKAGVLIGLHKKSVTVWTFRQFYNVHLIDSLELFILSVKSKLSKLGQSFNYARPNFEGVP